MMDLWTTIGVISGLVHMAAAFTLLGMLMTLHPAQTKEAKCRNRN